MSAGDLHIVETVESRPCPGIACGTDQGDGWRPSMAVRVRVGNADWLLCPTCGGAFSPSIPPADGPTSLKQALQMLAEGLPHMPKLHEPSVCISREDV